MAARVGNTREGYMHENLGCHLLRSISVVAQVPAYDDVGLDALATLLRPPVKALKYAEGGTFGVQFKAVSVDAIRYNWDEKEKTVKDKGHIQWLRDLEVPFFIGVVDDEKATIALHTTQAVYNALLHGQDIQALDMVFAKEAAKKDDLHPAVYLGPPILVYDVFSSNKDGFYDSAFNVMKPWLELETENVLTRKLRFMEIARWKTGQAPKRALLSQRINPLGPQVSTDVLNALRTPLKCFAVEMLCKGNPGDVDVVERTMDLMKQAGLDPDPERVIDTLRPTLSQFQKTNEKARLRKKSASK